jgi:hypothetical protein
MRKQYISLPALQRKIGLRQYVQAVKLAKAHKTERFSTGLTCWWPCTGEDVVNQFRTGMHDRINRHLPHFGKGRKWKSIYQTELSRDCRRIRERVNDRVILRQIMTPELKHRFGYLLFDDN